MSVKYSTARSLTLGTSGDVGITDHAIHRFRQRTPHDCDLSMREAWRLGEDIRDPAVIRSPDDDRVPERARLYRDAAGWGIVFLVDRDTRDAAEKRPHHGEFLVASVFSLTGIEHRPSRAYLEAYGPHGGRRDGE